MAAGRGAVSTVGEVLGYCVTAGDGSTRVIEASDDAFGDDGVLSLSADGGIVARFEAEQWESVEAIGVRLSSSWPDPRLEGLLEKVKRLLATEYGHYVHLVGGPDKYSFAVFKNWTR